MNRNNRIGYIVEAWVRYQLAKKGIHITKLRDTARYDYDFLTEDDVRIEVKSSRVHSSSGYPVWRFSLKRGRKERRRSRNFDLFILVGFLGGDPEACFVVPKDKLAGQNTLQVRANYAKVRDWLVDYRDSWDLVKYPEDG